MIKVPNDIIVKLRIASNKFSIIWFRDLSHQEGSPPHFYINVPVKQKHSLLICMITKQIDKIKCIYSCNPKALKSLIVITKTDLHFLNPDYPSVIDCNRAELILKGDLIKRIDPQYNINIKMDDKDIPKSLKQKIIGAIKSSPLIKPFIKNLLD